MKMSWKFGNILVAIVVLIIPVLGIAGVGGDVTSSEVAGVVGLRPAEAQSYVAIWLPVPEGQALSGVEWFNNDANVVFPEVLLESGTPNNPAKVTEALVVAEGVQGVSDGWSELVFDQPVACLSEGLYLLIRFPVGSDYIAAGLDGGAALGYQTNGQGYAGWISADGQSWVALDGDFGFALRPQFVDATDGGVVMNGMQRSPNESVLAISETALLRAAPNPFNPSTKLRFNLVESGHVKLSIYNLKGERVRQLVNQVFGQGSHEIVWKGRDDADRGVSSGVYFARFESGIVAMNQRLVLVQ